MARSEPAVVVKNLMKTFKIPVDKASGVKQMIVRLAMRKRGYRTLEALSDMSFEVKKGEFFGIVGKNGSGKSTLLKLLSGIYVPDKGLVQVNGSLTPFIELGVGFNPELSGRENVFLNGALLGFSRKEIESMYNEIVSFAELEDFMAEKLKNYSSGMQVRLAFSIAIRARSDVLIMDEVLAVGDADFQKKCFNVFRELKKQGRTIILVTHDMGNVERFCDRVLIVDKGKQLAITTPAKAASMYARLNIDENEIAIEDTKAQQKGKVRLGTGDVRAAKLTLLQNGKATKIAKLGEDLTLQLDLKRSPKFADRPVLFGASIRNQDGHNIAGPNSRRATLKPNAQVVSFTIPKLKLAPGEYSLTVVLFDPEDMTRLDVLEDWLHFSVIADHEVIGLVELDGRWESK